VELGLVTSQGKPTIAVVKLAVCFTVSTPKLITPNVYSHTELTVGMECTKRPLFIIISTAAKVTDRPFMFHK